MFSSPRSLRFCGDSGPGEVFEPFTVEVPATTANLGPGFDALGLALGLHNRFTFAPAPAGDIEVQIEGEGQETLSRDTRNLIIRAAQAVAAEAGQGLPPFR